MNKYTLSGTKDFAIEAETDDAAVIQAKKILEENHGNYFLYSERLNRFKLPTLVRYFAEAYRGQYMPPEVS